MSSKKKTLNQIRPAALVICALPGAVSASPTPFSDLYCAPSTEMALRLEGRFLSNRVWQGVQSPDQVMELWEDHQGDWMLAIVYASGRTCIVATGDALSGFPELS